MGAYAIPCSFVPISYLRTRIAHASIPFVTSLPEFCARTFTGLATSGRAIVHAHCSHPTNSLYLNSEGSFVNCRSLSSKFGEHTGFTAEYFLPIFVMYVSIDNFISFFSRLYRKSAPSASHSTHPSVNSLGAMIFPGNSFNISFVAPVAPCQEIIIHIYRQLQIFFWVLFTLAFP